MPHFKWHSYTWLENTEELHKYGSKQSESGTEGHPKIVYWKYLGLFKIAWTLYEMSKQAQKHNLIT